MRLALLLSTLFLLTTCGDVQDYNATSGESPSSLMGSQGGGGVTTDIWSNNPSEKTWANESQYGP